MTDGLVERDAWEGVEGDVPEEPEHWVAVYSELVRFCEAMLARPEDGFDRVQLGRHLQRYRSGLGFWERRRSVRAASEIEQS